MSQRAFVFLKGYSEIDLMYHGDLGCLCCSQAAEPSLENIYFSKDLSLPLFAFCFGAFCSRGILDEKLRCESGSILQSFVMLLQTCAQKGREGEGRGRGWERVRDPSSLLPAKLFDITRISSSHGGNIWRGLLTDSWLHWGSSCHAWNYTFVFVAIWVISESILQRGRPIKRLTVPARFSTQSARTLKHFEGIHIWRALIGYKNPPGLHLLMLFNTWAWTLFTQRLERSIMLNGE